MAWDVQPANRLELSKSLNFLFTSKPPSFQVIGIGAFNMLGSIALLASLASFVAGQQAEYSPKTGVRSLWVCRSPDDVVLGHNKRVSAC